MLDCFSRVAIVALSALCVALAFALAPIRARGSMAELRFGPITGSAPVAPRALRAAPIVRDPFAEPNARAVPPAAATAGYFGVLPSNLPHDTIPALPGASSDTPARESRITAIVTGARPYALVESDGVHAIKGIGDRIGGQQIVTIGLDGIRLQDGVYLPVGAAQP